METIKTALIKRFEDVASAQYVYITHNDELGLSSQSYAPNVAVIRYIGRENPAYAEIISEFVEDHYED